MLFQNPDESGQRPNSLSKLAFLDDASELHKQTTGHRRLSRVNENVTLYLNGDAHAPAGERFELAGSFFY